MSFPNKKVNVKFGYKAVGEDLGSLNHLSSRAKKRFFFKINEWHEVENRNKRISPASNGFHYCKYLKEVLSRYPIEGKTIRETGKVEKFRYFYVEAGDVMIQDKKEIATDRIRLLKELSKEEIGNILKSEEMNKTRGGLLTFIRRKKM